MLEPQRSAVLGYFDTRFGIPLITFDSFCLLLRHKTYCLLSVTSHIERLAGLQVHSVGLPVLRSIRHHLKPTTAALQYFGVEARRHDCFTIAELMMYEAIGWAEQVAS